MKNNKKNVATKLSSYVELSKEECMNVNGGDDVTEPITFAFGVFIEFVSRGFAAARRGSPGAYIPNL